MNTTLENKKSEEFVEYLEQQINKDFRNINDDEKDKILRLVDNCLTEYDKMINSTFVNATPINMEDNTVNDASATNNNTNNNTRSIINKLKKGSNFLYNTTIAEARNGRIPILDSIHRTIYRKLYNRHGEHGSTVFPEREGYYKLGGKKNSRSKRNSKTMKNKK